MKLIGPNKNKFKVHQFLNQSNVKNVLSLNMDLLKGTDIASFIILIKSTTAPKFYHT